MAKADTSVKYFHSAMPGAPALSGTAGSLIAVLDACLVNGFGLKTVDTLVVVGNVATATISTGHSAEKDTVVLIAGATPAELNGEWKVASTTANTITFITESILDQTAAGTITLKMAPAGWAKPFSGTNLAAYKSTDITATGCLLRVDDTATTLVRVVGYESMSDINTGVGPFPTAAQIAGGGYWPKSTNAGSTANAWVIASDGKFTILHAMAGYNQGLAYTNGYTRFFGDPIALKPAGDPYFYVLNYSVTTNPAGMYEAALDGFNVIAQTATSRSHTGLGSCVLHVHLPYTGTVGTISGIDVLQGTFPSEIDGKLRLSRRYIAETSMGKAPRGDIPGWFHVPQGGLFSTFKLRDTVTSDGRNLLAVFSGSNNPTVASQSSSGTGIGFIDITGPWR